MNRRSLPGIAYRAERLAESGKVQGKGWSLAQICEHLALSIENTVRGSAAEGVPRRWLRLRRREQFVRWCLKTLMLWTGYFPKGAPAPESVQPAPSASLDEAIARLRAAGEAFDRKLADREASWNYHSLLGRMTGRTWRRFHWIHANHHFSFLTVATTR